MIGFELPEEGEAIITVYDAVGKVLKIVKGNFSEGYNEVILKHKDLGVARLLYYQLDSGVHQAVKKIIIVK